MERWHLKRPRKGKPGPASGWEAAHIRLGVCVPPIIYLLGGRFWALSAMFATGKAGQSRIRMFTAGFQPA